ncbi:MAG: ClbS/DfsB family four-helix bundle protein [Chloroflexi bacterium]|nr:ClbS/DfsB family four-helix bundle protein [Chloroflexota bacterium]
MALRKPKTKEEFFKRERETWDELDALIADLPDAAWLRPGAAGEWSLKDVWAHIAAWMKKTRGIMPRLLNGDQVPANIQSFNEEQYLKNRKTSLDVVRRRIERERNQILSMIEKIPKEQLLKSSRVYSWASFSTFNHYHEHIPALKKFRRVVMRKM